MYKSNKVSKFQLIICLNFCILYSCTWSIFYEPEDKTVVFDIPAAEMCDLESDYTSRFVCKEAPTVPLNPTQELAEQIRCVNEITRRTMPEERVSEITNILVQECPDYALDIYLIGVPESYNWNRNHYEGDYRIYYDSDESCENCEGGTRYSEGECDPDSDSNCTATSCGPFHIRHIYPSRNFSCEELKNERFSVQWMCDWMSDYYPNIAGHNGGVMGSRDGRSDKYGYRHFLLKQLAIDENCNNEEWGWGNNNRIVYRPTSD